MANFELDHSLQFSPSMGSLAEYFAAHKAFMQTL